MSTKRKILIGLLVLHRESNSLTTHIKY